MLEIQQILEATKGKLFSNGKRLNHFKGVSINTRTIRKNDLFIAIKGERFDGHDFINEALKNGASCVVVSNKSKVKKGIPFILVKDTVKALGWIALSHRNKYSIPVVAITGSTGKTTVKEIVSRILESKYKVLKNIKTENNHIGVPLTLLKLKDSHNIAVLELGTNQPGDISWLGEIVRPDVCIFTNIGESHLLKLKSPAGVFREKFNLVKYMKPRGVIIYNKDDQYLRKISRTSLGFRKISFSIKEKSSFKAGQISCNLKGYNEFKVNGRKILIKSPARHNIYNGLAGICCGKLFGVSYNNIRLCLKKFTFKDGRFEINRVRKFLIINDTYNANPLSFRSAVSALENIPFNGFKVVVCADMLELGGDSKKLHSHVGRIAGNSKIDIIFSYGNHSRQITKEAKKRNPFLTVKHFTKRGDLHKALGKMNKPSCVLFKGSRGMRMEKTVEYFTKRITS